jgi:prephenate dehydrogenase
LTTVGLIGYGSFGELVTQLLNGKVTLKVASRTISKIPEQLQASMNEVAACDYLIISVPLKAYRAVLNEVAQYIRPNTVVVDVCSVKVVPSRIIKELLPGNRFVATHPLFGPQTAKDGLTNHVMVLCDDVSDAEQLAIVEKLSQSIGLHVERMTTDEHDRQMAHVQALTFFISEVLNEAGTEDIQLKTPSYKRLTDLAQLVSVESHDLLELLQHGNPYAATVRERFVSSATKLDSEINATQIKY